MWVLSPFIALKTVFFLSVESSNKVTDYPPKMDLPDFFGLLVALEFKSQTPKNA